MRRKMEVENPIYMAPNSATFTRVSLLNIRFALSNETGWCWVDVSICKMG